MRLIRIPMLLAPAALPLLPASARAEAAAHGGGDLPPVWLVLFFVAMLLSIAILPLTRARHWWEHNRNRLLVAVLVSAWPAVYYLQHDPAALEHTLVNDYVPFIVLLGSLFMITGGIRLTGDLRATPAVNTAFLAIGSLLASFIGTTGASVLLIRPLLQTNRERIHRVHTVVFFIFLVSNIGGSLLPVGDPPLFLGYLYGIPFFWTFSLWKVWLPAVVALLALYYLLDRRYYAKEPAPLLAQDARDIEPLRLEGVHNFAWLLGVVAAVVFVNGNSPVALLRTPHLREGVMLVMVGLAWLTTAPRIRKANGFTMGPIAEVAALFLGIFITVIPALVLLNARGAELGIDTPAEFFWSTGALSSFLDNAPTYLVFFKTASGLVTSGAAAGVDLVGTGIDRIPVHFLEAISCGAVFMGANTYIGNGPNFMVKAIAEEAGIRMPSFGGYMKWSILILLPLFGVLTLIFFARG